MQTTLNAPRRGGSSINGWYVVGLLASLGLHTYAYRWAGQISLEGFSREPAAALAPPSFVVKQVSIDPRTLQDAPPPPKAEEKQPVVPEKLVFSEAKPQAMDVDLQVKPVEKKKLSEEKMEAAVENVPLAGLKSAGPSSLDSELRSLAGNMLQAGPTSKAQPVLAMATEAGVQKAGRTGAAGKEGNFTGRVSLEDALDALGKIPTRESPVAIPGNALFGYDSSELGPESLPVLEKIAELRRRFPNDVLMIVGHTDASGTEEYNLRLSQRRADAVKEWLVRRHKMDPSKLETSGRGSAELIVPAGSVEDQAPNRRVEAYVVPINQHGKNPKR
jgi:outer membrane protein OmpA-like peptidoglycan-associated protein